jgi:hypothetical protein
MVGERLFLWPLELEEEHPSPDTPSSQIADVCAREETRSQAPSP